MYYDCAPSTLIAASIIATTTAGTISFECKLFEFLFGDGVWGTRLESDVSQTRHEQNTSSKRFIRRGLGDGLEDATGDALSLALVILVLSTFLPLSKCKFSFVYKVGNRPSFCMEIMHTTLYFIISVSRLNWSLFLTT
jgi:hypothetical protein